MRMEDFKETIAKEMEARIKGVKITPTKNWKNNGIVRNGLTICKEQEDVAPVLYIDSFFECYKKGELSVEDIIEQVVCDYQNLSTPDIPDLDILLSADAIMNKLNLRLLNWEMNKERIEECHLLYHLVEGTDLVCLFYVDIYDEGECSGAICLTEKIKEKYLTTISSTQELYQSIIDRVNPEDVYLESMKDVIKNMISCTDYDENFITLLEEQESKMYVLSNKEKKYGAYAILAEETREKILQVFPKGKVIVLPSSVHEQILIEKTGEEDIECLKLMVKEVNLTAVRTDEVLSFKVYQYDAITGKYEIVE